MVLVSKGYLSEYATIISFGLSLTDINEILQTGVLILGLVAGTISVIKSINKKK